MVPPLSDTFLLVTPLTNYGSCYLHVHFQMRLGLLAFLLCLLLHIDVTVY
jgi:hypothetical protein